MRFQVRERFCNRLSFVRVVSCSRFFFYTDFKFSEGLIFVSFVYECVFGFISVVIGGFYLYCLFVECVQGIFFLRLGLGQVIVVGVDLRMLVSDFGQDFVFVYCQENDESWVEFRFVKFQFNVLVFFLCYIFFCSFC